MVGANTVDGTGNIDLSGGGDALSLYINGVKVQDGGSDLVIDSSTTWNDVVTAINTTAALGGEIEVPTLDGKVSLKIPAETQTGKVFRLRGKGVRPVRGGAQGDRLVTVHVETPVKLTDAQRELLEAFEQSLGSGAGEGVAKKHRPRQHSFLDSVRRFFDDLRGEPMGHFVVLSGMQDDTVFVADPYKENPLAGKSYYDVPINRLLNAILLGIVTYDANMLIVQPQHL